MGKTINELTGPKGIPLLGAVFKLDLPRIHQQIEDWSDQYGDVFRLDSVHTNQMGITRPCLIHQIASERPHAF